MFLLIAIVIGFQLVSALPQDGTEDTRKPVINSEEFFYQVLISEYDEGPRCGGTVVEKGYIITSATCIWKFGGIKRFLESVVLYGGGASLLYELGEVTDAIVDSQYLSNPQAHDLAVLKYVPNEKAPQLKYVTLNRTYNEPETCIMSSWWVQDENFPERLMWIDVTPIQCSTSDYEFLCFKEDSLTFLPMDYGSPVVCNGILRGLIPADPFKQAINVTAKYDWIAETIAKLKILKPSSTTTEDDNKPLLLTILDKLDVLIQEDKTPDSQDIGANLSRLNNQVVIPLSYVLFALVIFFFVLLFFIIVFTVVLVYYSRK